MAEATASAGKQKLTALTERLAEEATAIRTAGDWERHLRAAARLPGESFANILLVEAQRPGATILKGYAEWQAEGRQANRGEAGIEVFPASQHDDPANRGRTSRVAGKQHHLHWRDAAHVSHVWDISQTSGPPCSPG